MRLGAVGMPSRPAVRRRAPGPASSRSEPGVVSCPAARPGVGTCGLAGTCARPAAPRRSMNRSSGAAHAATLSRRRAITTAPAHPDLVQQEQRDRHHHHRHDVRRRATAPRPRRRRAPSRIGGSGASPPASITPSASQDDDDQRQLEREAQRKHHLQHEVELGVVGDQRLDRLGLEAEQHAQGLRHDEDVGQAAPARNSSSPTKSAGTSARFSRA